MDVHHDELSFDGLLILDGRHTEVTLKFLHELINVVAADLEAFKICREFLPSLLERCHIILEAIEHIIGREVVQVELLKDDEHEEIHHDVLLDEHKHDEEQGGPGSAAVASWDAVFLGIHQVIHDHRPILACRKAKHKHH